MAYLHLICLILHALLNVNLRAFKFKWACMMFMQLCYQIQLAQILGIMKNLIRTFHHMLQLQQL